MGLVYTVCMSYSVSLSNLCKLSNYIPFQFQFKYAWACCTTADSKGREQEVAGEILSQAEGGLRGES